MRTPAVTARDTLHSRLSDPAQTPSPESNPAANMPPYMESLLAHLRLLVGVPMEYLIPDDRLLPPESIRFFYLDRSWADRLVDGAIAVGQIGSREQAHYHARGSSVAQRLDQTERAVRNLQRGQEFHLATDPALSHSRSADVVTGFILRSAAVKQWPHMDVRAYNKVIAGAFDVAQAKADGHQLNTLRLEIIAPSVMIALFEGEPAMVTLEEPHHGVQFGVRFKNGGPGLSVPLRDETGHQIVVDKSGKVIQPGPNAPDGDAVPVTVPTRYGHNDVVRVAALRDALQQQTAKYPDAIGQTGSAAFAISLLDPPWRQHFEGTEDHGEADSGGLPSVFVKVINLVKQEALHQNLNVLLGKA